MMGGSAVFAQINTAAILRTWDGLCRGVIGDQAFVFAMLSACSTEKVKDYAASRLMQDWRVMAPSL